jgi:hypothetical protein
MIMLVKQPHRIRHTYTQSLAAPPERVFPLLCPVRETEWVPDWAPECVVSTSGVMEKGCLFVTPDELADAVWIAVRHDPAAFYLELLKVVPNHLVCRYEIRLTPDPDDRTTATIHYSCTALSPAGEAFVDTLTPVWYENFMRRWETALNYYLANGRMIGVVDNDTTSADS